MTIEERRERGRLICLRLSEDVARLAPVGIGFLSETCEIVGDADAVFVLTLAQWEQAPTDDHREQVAAAYDRVLAAWRHAVAAFLANNYQQAS